MEDAKWEQPLNTFHPTWTPSGPDLIWIHFIGFCWVLEVFKGNILGKPPLFFTLPYDDINDPPFEAAYGLARVFWG